MITLVAGQPCGPVVSSPRIARRGRDSSQHLGRHRWVVERTFAWLNRFRRLRVRYERRADIHQAFLTLGLRAHLSQSSPSVLLDALNKDGFPAMPFRTDNPLAK